MPQSAVQAAERRALPMTAGVTTALHRLDAQLDRPVRTPPPIVLRVRQAAVCLLLVVVAFLQRPGAVSADTKLDLTYDPDGWLAAALRVWTPDAFGSLQNQAYGYLVPMGPFHLLGMSAGLPPWVVQRLWWSALLVAAFLGTLRLAARLGIGSPGLRVLAGLAYALSPRVLTELGGISSELLPLAALPWILVPLTGPTALALPRRAGARSAVGVLLAGAVNAAATLLVLPLAVLWLLPGLRTAGGRRLAAWWALAAALACAWWVVPLLVQGAYSPPFLDYIEDAATTTMLTSLVEVLRGSSHWLSYLAVDGSPYWRAGWTLATSPGVILDTAVVAALGLAGLSLRSMPRRGALGVSALLGLAVMALGHVGPVGSPLAETVRDLLDGPLAPFRNVHKADPLLRLPLVLGLCHLVAAVPRRRPRRLLALVAAVALLGAATPAVAGQLPTPGAFRGIPGYWFEAAAYVDEHAGNSTTLLVPAAGDAEHLWGRPLDDPLQVLARSPVAVRDAVPLGGPEVTRVLDAVGARLDTGRGSPGLATVLARSGVRHVVVRNDLDPRRTTAPRPALVREALEDSPGLELVAAFGPWLGDPAVRDGLVFDRGLDLRRRAVEVWRVQDADGPVTAYPVAGTWSLVGGPEAVLSLADRGLLDGAATVQRDDAGPQDRVAVTDTARRQAVDVGRVRENRSPTLEAADGTEHQPVPGVPDDRLVVADWTGAERIRASSSAADVDTLLHRAVDRGPAAAFDGDRTTYWASGALTGPRGQWLEVVLDEPTDLDGLSVSLAGPAASGYLAQIAEIEVRTERGAVRTRVQPTERAQRVAVPDGPTERLRVVVTRAAPTSFGGLVGIRELDVPGVDVGRTLVLPPAPPGATAPGSVVLLDEAVGGRDGCVQGARSVRCSPDLPRPGEDTGPLTRVVQLPAPADVEVSARARPRPGLALDALLDEGAPVRVTASSRAVLDPRGRPGAVVDGDSGTGWVAAVGDDTPTLDLRWDGPRTVEGVQLTAAPAYVVAARATRVRLDVGGRSITRSLNDDGRVLFREPVTTDRLRITVLDTDRLVDAAVGGRLTAVPVGFPEVRVLGPDDLAARPLDADAPVTVACEDGPVLDVAGEPVRTSATTTRGDLLSLRPVALTACAAGTVALPAGDTAVVASPSAALDVSGVTLAVPPGGAAPAGRDVDVVRWDAERRAVDVQAGAASWLTVHEAFNEGWQATLDGQVLEPARVDGWQQAWRLPAGDGGRVVLSYQPGDVQRAGLLAGAAAVLVLLWLALRRGPTRPVGPAPCVRRRPRALALLPAVALGLLGGPAGLAVWAVVAVLALRWRRVLPVVAAGSMTAAGVLVAAGPWGGLQSPASQGAPANVLALVAVAALAVSLVSAGAGRAAPAASGAAPAPRPAAG